MMTFTELAGQLNRHQPPSQHGLTLLTLISGLLISQMQRRELAWVEMNIFSDPAVSI
jgi:hypothetical protein